MLKSFSILLQTSPLNSSAAWTALEFVKALYEQNHTLKLLFLTQDATLLANSNLSWPTDEPNCQHHWQLLQKQHAFDILVCSTSAERRGVVMANLASGFQLGSFGQWFTALHDTDHVLTLD